eukprot:scaffold393445_cov17-Prasinocladus_malaysianus.AAC.2
MTDRRDIAYRYEDKGESTLASHCCCGLNIPYQRFNSQLFTGPMHQPRVPIFLPCIASGQIKLYKVQAPMST